MKKIINWTFGSFFRTIGRFMFYILLGFLISYLLQDFKFPKIDIWQILDVNALENKDIFADYNLSDSGMFWNVSSSGTTQKGYQLFTTNSQNAWYYASPTSNISLTYLGGGMAITQCGYGFLENNYYTISYVFNSGYSTYLHPYYTNRSPNVVGISDTNGTYRNDITFTDISNGIEQVYYADGFYVDTFSLIFKSNRNGSCITTTFSANDNISYTDYFFYRGIKVTNLGQKVPTTEEITNALSSNFTNVINNNNTNTNSIINNQNQNKQDIINNQNANSQAEIQNANENTDKTIDSQKVCKVYDKNSIYRDNARLQGNGNNITDNDFGTTDFISINKETEVKLLINYPSAIVRLCFYNINKTYVSCISQNDINVGDYVTIPDNASYMKFSINKSNNAPQYQICKNGNQAMTDTLTDDSINENGANDFVNGLDKEYSSLTPFSDFINLPLTWIQSLFSSQNSCEPINLPLPYLNNKTLTLPCMTDFWERMGALGTLIQIVWIAIVGVRIFNGLFLLTCETLDPNPDKDMTKLRTWEL